MDGGDLPFHVETAPHSAPLEYTNISLTGDYVCQESAVGAVDFLPFRLNERLGASPKP